MQKACGVVPFCKENMAIRGMTGSRNQNYKDPRRYYLEGESGFRPGFLFLYPTSATLGSASLGNMSDTRQGKVSGWKPAPVSVPP